MSEDLKGLIATLTMLLPVGALTIGALVFPGQKKSVDIVIDQSACEVIQQPQGGKDV